MNLGHIILAEGRTLERALSDHGLRETLIATGPLIKWTDISIHLLDREKNNEFMQIFPISDSRNGPSSMRLNDFQQGNSLEK